MIALGVALVILLLIGLRLNKVLQDRHDGRNGRPLPPAHTPEDPFRHHRPGCGCAWHR